MRRAATGTVMAVLAGSVAVSSAGAAPVAEISSPAELGAPDSCFAIGEILSIRGVSYDTVSGNYASDRLEYRPLNSSTWTLIGTAASPLATPGALYNWDTSAIPSEGVYLLRMTTVDTSGASDTDQVVIWMSAGIDEVSAGAPSAVVASKACFTGTIRDANSPSMGYTVDYRAAGTGDPFDPVDPAFPDYNGPVFNSTLATWNTADVPDGDYEIRVRGINACGAIEEIFLSRRVDNTPPVALLADAGVCTRVPLDAIVPINGSATDTNLKSWTLSVIGGPFADWQTIGGDSTNAVGTLASWNTAGLPDCAYVLRLEVEQLGEADCTRAVVSTAYRSVTIGCKADLATNGILNIDDIDAFVSLFLSGDCD